MSTYRNALWWAAAILGVALAGRLEVIDQEAMSSLLIALLASSTIMVRGRASRLSCKGPRA